MEGSGDEKSFSVVKIILEQDRLIDTRIET